MEEMRAMGFKQRIKLLLAYAGVVVAVVTVLKFVKFLSYLPAEEATSSAEWKSEQEAPEFFVRKTVWVLFQDFSYLCGFFFVHSYLANARVKEFFTKYGLQEIERSVYVIFSCIALQVVVNAWKPISWVCLWDVSVSDSPWMWWLYTFIHSYFWLHLYASNLIMDISELLGVKQVEYGNRGLPSPDSYKSASLKRLRRHMNHTSFIGFSILFWAYPQMRLDRAVLAALIQLYMSIMWGTCPADRAYLIQQFEDKILSLKN